MASSTAQAIADPNRLPWLADETPRTRRSERSSTQLLLGVGSAATALLAGLSYWVGMNSAAPLDEQPSRSTATMALPEPQVQQRVEAEVVTRPVVPEVRPAPQPVIEPPRIQAVEPAPSRELSGVAPAPRSQRAVVRKRAAKALTAKASASAVTARTAGVRAPRPLARKQRPWPATESAGAHGRLVRIGTFASPRQAKRAWWTLSRLYPGYGRLPARVVPIRSMRDGRVYYRLQNGTTSQAHSAALCQRLRMVGQPCVVLALPGQGAA